MLAEYEVTPVTKELYEYLEDLSKYYNRKRTTEKKLFVNNTNLQTRSITFKSRRRDGCDG